MTLNQSAPESLLDERQGGPGRIGSIDYAKGSFADNLVEAFSGIHDLLNSPFGYDNYGNARHMTPLGRSLYYIYNGGNLLVAAPFATASLISADDSSLVATPPAIDKVRPW